MTVSDLGIAGDERKALGRLIGQQRHDAVTGAPCSQHGDDEIGAGRQVQTHQRVGSSCRRRQR